MSPFLLCAVLLFPFRTLAQSNARNIAVGAYLTAAENSNAWLSPSGDFAFGFRPLSKDLFLLSIWFDKIPNKTIVWYERSSYPVPRGSIVRLEAENGIVLRDRGGRLLYNTSDLADRVAHGSMNDTGNLVLWRSDSTSLWESFQNPTDTMLPTQTLPTGVVLISRKTETNFSLGRFYARMNSYGDFVLNTKTDDSNTGFDDEYYSTLISNPTLNSSNQLVFDGRASMYVRGGDGEELQVISLSSIPPPSENYYRATLDFDGVFTQYYHPRDFGSNPRWTVAKTWPDNICLSIDGDRGSGACGYNNVCWLENQRHVCKCPPGFSLADPSNPNGDCKPKFVPCVQGDPETSPEDEFEMFNVSDYDWPKNDYEQIDPSTEEQCRSLCLNDCFCAVAIFRSGMCWKKRLPLSNGKVDTTLGSTAFLKYRKGDSPSVNPNRPGSPNDKPKSNRGTLILVGSMLLGGSVFVNCLLIGAGCLGFFFIYKKKSRILNLVQDTSTPNLRCFTYQELVQATGGFKEEIGRGSFGIVYKGVMPNASKSIIAVKKLDRVAEDSEKEFRAEVNAIGQTHHKNLVSLLGFCDQGPHRLLVYEYMSNGTLADFLFGDLRPRWRQRTQMALGVARGLTYLHEECRTLIIHCDIKPQNILLDQYYNARISDFGLAKLLVMNQSRTHTNIRGTKGYVAPEWFRNTKINVKVDVYSFGVLLLEIISCKKSLDYDLESEGDGENPILTDWVWDCFMEGNVGALVGNDEEALSDREVLDRFVMVGIWCIQEDASIRPTMRKACQMLEGVVEIEVPPCPCSFT